MSLKKQAKTLSKQQCDAVLGYLTTTRHPVRNRLIFLLSVRAGLRAKEIAGLTWTMVLTSEGVIADDISLHDLASKGRSGRTVPICRELKRGLTDWREVCGTVDAGDSIIRTERSRATSPQVIINLFKGWYRALRFEGCSSHSGRRTFITNAARKISTVGGSLRDVQSLAGHSSLTTTQRYIDVNPEAKRRVVELGGWSGK
jgi:integrase/recombinase XerD